MLQMNKERCGFAVGLIFALLAVARGAIETIKIAGKVDKSVTLPCSVPHGSPPDVHWSDTVHNTQSYTNASIFSSLANSTHALNPDHPNRADYSVDRSTYSLTIRSLTSDDAGKYTCLSHVKGTTDNKTYDLSIHGELNCSGLFNLEEGQETYLSCSMYYSGIQPKLEWLRNDIVIPSEDKSGEGQMNEDYDYQVKVNNPAGSMDVKKVTRFNVTHDDDGVVYKCGVNISSTVDECELLMNITYAVRAVKFTSNKTVYYVGEEVKCEARGNPTPVISLTSINLTEEITSGPGWRSFRVPAAWIGHNMSVYCVAQNKFQAINRKSSATLTIFNVIDAPVTKAVHSDSLRPVRSTLMAFTTSLLTFVITFHGIL